MKKSLFITIDFPPQIGGVAVYIYNLCKNFPKDKIIVLANNYPASENFDNKQNFKIIRKNFYPKWWKLIFFIYKIIKKDKIKLIHNSHVIPLGYITFLLKKFLQIDYIIYLHGLDFKLAYSSSFKRFLLRLILKNAFLIVVNSIHVKNLVLNGFPFLEKKIKVIYPCPQEDLLNINLDKDLINQYKKTDEKILLTVARLVKRKGIQRVLKVLPKLNTYFNVKYIIIGDGEYKNFLEDLVKELNLDKNVEFISGLEKQKLVNYYFLCDVFVMPNIEMHNDVEGFGIVFLEAGLFKKPVIGGNNGGVKEAIVDNYTGFLIDSDDELFEKIFILLKDKNLCKQFGENSYKRIHKIFNWKKQVDLLLKYLN